MTNPKLSRSLVKYNDSALGTKAESIVLALTDNDNFPKPNPALATIRDATGSFNDAIAAAVDGSRIKIAERKQARKTLEALLLQLNAYVTMTAMGDVNILISSGFDLYKKPETPPAVNAPQAPRLTSGANSGEVHVRVSFVKGTRAYIFEHTTDPLSEDNVWQHTFETRSRCLITGLQYGKKHWFRVTAIGLRGVKAVSKAVSYMVQ